MTNADFGIWIGSLFLVWGVGFGMGFTIYSIRRFFDLI